MAIAYTESAEIQGFTIGEPYPIEETLARYLDGSGACMIRSDLASMSDEDLCWAERTARAAGFRCVGMVPLMGENMLVGLLHVFSKEPNAYTLTDLAPLALLAPLVAAALQNARAQEQAERLVGEAAARAAELATSQIWLHSVLAQIPHGVLVVDGEGRVVLTNPAMENFVPVPPRIGSPIADLQANYQIRGPVGSDALASVDSPLARALAGELVRPTRLAVRHRFATKDVWLDISAAPLRDTQGASSGALVVLSDVTEQEELRGRAVASEARLRAAYQAISGGVLVLDASGMVVEVNAAAEEILGADRETMIGFPVHMAPWSLTHRDGTPLVIEDRPAHIALREQRALRQLPVRVVRSDGSERLVEMDAVPRLGPDGTVEHVVISYSDLTERVRAEQALRTSQELLRMAVTNAPIVITMVDQIGVITFSEGRGLQRLGRAPGATVGQSAFTLFRDSPPVLAGLQRVLGGESTSCVVDLGSVIFETLYTPLYAEDGSVRGAISVSTDITERVKNEEALRASEARFRTAFAGAPIGMSLVGLDGRFVQVNPAMCTLLGYAESDFLGAHVLRRVSSADLETARAYLRQLTEGRVDSATVEVRLLHKDDSLIWVQVSSTVLRDEHGQPRHVVNQVQDISARKEAESALKDEAARLSAVIDAQHAIAMAGLDLDAVMRLIVQYALSLTNATGSVIEMRDGDEMVYRACEGSVAGSEGMRLRVDGSLSGLCARTGDIQLCVDTRVDQRVDAAMCRKLDIGSMLLVPLVYEQNTIGVVKVTHEDTHTFGERDVATLQLMTGLLSSAMSMCDAFAAEQQALEALMMSEERFRGMLEMAPVGACIISEEGIFESVNASICELYGFTREELTGRPFSIVLPAPNREQVMAAQNRELVVGEQRRGEGVVLTKDGRELTVLTNSVVFVGDDSRVHSAFFVFDITERKQFENQLTHVAHHDALTGLPNRVLYHDRLEQALLAAKRQGTALSILIIDLNGFKLVNDTLGHDAGDTLLQEIANRLLSVVRSGDTVARLGGDEFAVVLPQADEAGATRVANKIRAALIPVIALDGREAYVGGSIGIAVLGEHGDDPEGLQKAADLAMYAAKEAGGGHAVYSPRMAKESVERTEPRERRRSSIVAELRQAITRGDLRLHYQPLVSCTDGQVRRVEALVRWQHPKQGLLPPDYFIAAAEQSGAITPLTIWVLEEALRQCHAWHDQGLDLGIAVNVSLRTLRESQFPDLVAALLRQYRVSPSDLTLEITESSMLEEHEQTLAVLRDLAALGVRIALDDVGVGHSSLGYITQLPVHELKAWKERRCHQGQSSLTAQLSCLRPRPPPARVSSQRAWWRVRRRTHLSTGGMAMSTYLTIAASQMTRGRSATLWVWRKPENEHHIHTQPLQLKLLA